MTFLIRSRLVQVSVQKFKVLSRPEFHLIPLLKVSSPILTPLQVGEEGSLASGLELIHLLVQYFFLRTRTQRASISVWNLQLSLANKAVFLPLVV